MSDEPLHIIMAVENARLREALLAALDPLQCSPKVVLPDALLQAELYGDNLIFLETSDDTERLVQTAQQLWSKRGETGRAYVRFLSYSTEDVTPDSLVSRLWSIGPEMTVIVQIWRPDRLAERQQEAHAFTQRWLQSSDDSEQS